MYTNIYAHDNFNHVLKKHVQMSSLPFGRLKGESVSTGTNLIWFLYILCRIYCTYSNLEYYTVPSTVEEGILYVTKRATDW
jgi:hypothetical protein